jgi:CBS domain-containing protein
MSSETTAAAAGKQGIVRYDPFAMLPFRGIDAGASFEQWLKLASSLTVTPRIFRVNWFLKDAQGKFVWPGFGENIRVIDWMMRRVKGLATARPTPLGLVPARDDFALPNDMAPSAYDTLFDAHRDIGLREAASKRRYLTSLGSSVPAALHAEIASEEKRLLEMPGGAGSPSASSKDSNGSAHARLRLGDVAVPAPIVVTPDTPLGTLERLMLENEIRHLPVVDGGRVVGLVSDRDVRWGRADNGKPTAAQVMSTDPYVASERADLAEVLSRLAEQKWGSVIMASDDGAVQGIFTTTDALNLLARRLGPG